jgi:hypothetical protein
MINYSVLINALIIIILIHLLIVHLSDNKPLYENYENTEEVKEKVKENKVKQVKVKENKKSEKESLDFLQDLNEEFTQWKPNTITPANTYDRMDSLNTPNFDSNVLDYTQFYKINNSESPKTSIRNNNIHSSFIKPTSSVSISPRALNKVDNGKVASRPSRNIPDYWEYSNDLPMNGGMFGSIVGLDGKESLFSSYDAGAVSFKKCAEEVVANIPHNDLRKPIVYN